MGRSGLVAFVLGGVGLAACSGVDEPDPATVVTVRVVDRAGQPGTGVIVQGNDAAGNLVDETTVGSDERVWLDVPAGGSITTHTFDPTISEEYRPHNYYTVLEVAPGDDILVRVWRGEPPAGTRLEVTVPALPAGATRFVLAAPCVEGGSDSGTAAALRLDDRCPDRGPVVATALDDAGAQLAYLIAADVDLTQGALTLSGPWLTPTRTAALEVTGFPAAGGNAALARGALVDGYPVHWGDARLTTTATTATATLPHPGVGDGAVYRLSTGNADFCRSQSQSYTRARAADVDGFALDLGELLPPVTSFTTADHQLSWAGGGGGLAVRAWVTAARGAGDVVLGPERNWTVVAPAGAGTVRFPAGVDFVWPTASDDRISAVGVSEIASTYWASYAEARQRHAEDPARIAGEFVTRVTARSERYDYLGCPLGP